MSDCTAALNLRKKQMRELSPIPANNTINPSTHPQNKNTATAVWKKKGRCGQQQENKRTEPQAGEEEEKKIKETTSKSRKHTT